MDVKEKTRRLKQFRALKREINQLSQRIARLEAEIERGGEYRRRGRVAQEHRARLIALRQRLAARRVTCMEQLGALYAFVDDIEDSLMRQIMAFRYVDGLTWKEVAVRIGERDEQYPRRLHNRCLDQRELPPLLIRDRGDARPPVGTAKGRPDGDPGGVAS